MPAVEPASSRTSTNSAGDLADPLVVIDEGEEALARELSWIGVSMRCVSTKA